MQATTPFPTLKKAESFWILEDRPECLTPLDARVQEVIKPALLVKSASGQTFLLFQEDKTNLLPASRDGSPLIDQLRLGCPK